MPADELAFLAEFLAERNILLVVDEVYHPLYFGAARATAVRLPNTVVIGDLSKAFSLSGLRIGWAIEPDAARRHQLIDARGYFTISNSAVTEHLAALALRHCTRLLKRLDAVARSNLAALDDFMQANDEVITWIRPVGGTTAFPWLNDGSDSHRLCESLAASGVLTAPGDSFSSPNHFRIGFARQAEGFADALAITSAVLRRGRWH